MAFGQGDNIALALVEQRVAAQSDVAVVIFLAQVVERTPCAKIAPAEIGIDNTHLGGFLHDAVVQTDVRAGGEHLLYECLLSRSAHHLVALLEHIGYRGLMRTESLTDSADIPEEDAGVPKELATLVEHFRQFEIRLLGEGLDRQDSILTFVLGSFELDIAVARFGTRGTHTERKQAVVIGDMLQSDFDGLDELILAEDEMVARGNDDISMAARVIPIDIGNALHSQPTTHDAGYMRHGVRHSRSCIAAGRLAEDLLGFELRQLLEHHIAVEDIRHDDDVLHRHKFAETVNRHLQQALACSEKVEELLGTVVAALRPKTTAYTTSHDDAEIAVAG